MSAFLEPHNLHRNDGEIYCCNGRPLQCTGKDIRARKARVGHKKERTPITKRGFPAGRLMGTSSLSEPWFSQGSSLAIRARRTTVTTSLGDCETAERNRRGEQGRILCQCCSSVAPGEAGWKWNSHHPIGCRKSSSRARQLIRCGAARKVTSGGGVQPGGRGCAENWRCKYNLKIIGSYPIRLRREDHRSLSSAGLSSEPSMRSPSERVEGPLMSRGRAAMVACEKESTTSKGECVGPLCI